MEEQSERIGSNIPFATEEIGNQTGIIEDRQIGALNNNSNPTPGDKNTLELSDDDQRLRSNSNDETVVSGDDDQNIINFNNESPLRLATDGQNPSLISEREESSAEGTLESTLEVDNDLSHDQLSEKQLQEAFADLSKVPMDVFDSWMKKYQPLPPLGTDQYKSMRTSIQNTKVRDAVKVDEHGNILDGHHRAQICREISKSCPIEIVYGLDETSKIELAIEANMARRNLTPKEKRAIFQKLYSSEKNDSITQTRQAGIWGVSQGTISNWIKSFIKINKSPDGKNRASSAGKAKGPLLTYLKKYVEKNLKQYRSDDIQDETGLKSRISMIQEIIRILDDEKVRLDQRLGTQLLPSSQGIQSIETE